MISVILATRNAAGTLERCLESLRSQTFRDFEVLVMDGASTDRTLDILQRSADIVSRWRSAADGGIFSAWNKALELARGEWICFLGADDWLWDADAFRRLVPALQDPKNHRVVYSRVRQLDSAGRVLGEQGIPWERAKSAFRSYRCLPHPGLMHHRSLFGLHGRFDERFRFAGDYEFLLRELRLADALFVPSLTVGAEFGGVTTSPENVPALLRETREALSRHGIRPPRLRWAYTRFSAWLYSSLASVLGQSAAAAIADACRWATLRGPRWTPARRPGASARARSG